MKHLKKFLAVLAAAALLLCAAPAAFAAQTLTLQTSSYVVSSAGAPVTSIARYDSNFELTIPFTLSEPVKAGTNFYAGVGGDNFALVGDWATGTVNLNGTTGTFFFPAGRLKYIGTGRSITVAVFESPSSTSTMAQATFDIGECTVTADSSASGSSSAVAAAPGLIVKSSSIGASSIDAGAEFTLSLTIYATASATENTNDVTVSIAPADGVVIASGSSTQYIGTMTPGTTKTVTFPMRASSSFTNGVSSVAVTLSGNGAKSGQAAAATGTTVSVPVNQPDRFEVSKVEMPQSLLVGQEDVVTVTFVNKGKKEVGNISVALSAQNIQETDQSQYVGNLAAGTENSVDFNIAPVAAGSVTGTITITYEAPSGETKTVTKDISGSAEEAAIDSGSMVDSGAMSGDSTGTQSGLSTSAKIGIGVGIAILILVIILIIRRRKAKAKALLEAQNEDL